MTAATTTPASQSDTSQSGTGGLDITQLLTDLDSATVAVQNNDWVTAGLYGATTALDVLGSGSNPLSAIADAGFGWITGLVSFLEAPLKTLVSDPSSISSSSQSLQGAGQDVSSLAGSYQQSAGTETTSWSGAGASGYQNTATELAGELRAIGKASAGVSSAISGAGKVIEQARQIVTQLITEAAGKINTIMTQAMAAAQVTGGASVAAAIPQAVQVAVEYGQKIAEKMGALLSSTQNLAALVLVVLRTLEAVNTAITQTTGHSTQSTSTSTQKTASAGSGTSGAGQRSTDESGVLEDSTSGRAAGHKLSD